jgi:transposase|nr:transposase [Bifidobacterium crudilactis]
MARRYSQEFRERAVRLLADSRVNYSSETKALEGVAKSLGIAAESLRRWQERADAANTAGPGESEELKKLRCEVAQLRRANEILSSASAFFAARLDPHGADERVY